MCLVRWMDGTLYYVYHSTLLLLCKRIVRSLTSNTRTFNMAGHFSIFLDHPTVYEWNLCEFVF